MLPSRPYNFLALLAQVIIRIPHEQRRRKSHVAVERVNTLERALVSAGLCGAPRHGSNQDRVELCSYEPPYVPGSENRTDHLTK